MYKFRMFPYAIGTGTGTLIFFLAFVTPSNFLDYMWTIKWLAGMLAIISSIALYYLIEEN